MLDLDDQQVEGVVATGLATRRRSGGGPELGVHGPDTGALGVLAEGGVELGGVGPDPRELWPEHAGHLAERLEGRLQRRAGSVWLGFYPDYLDEHGFGGRDARGPILDEAGELVDHPGDGREQVRSPIGRERSVRRVVAEQSDDLLGDARRERAQVGADVRGHGFEPQLRAQTVDAPSLSDVGSVLVTGQRGVPPPKQGRRGVAAPPLVSLGPRSDAGHSPGLFTLRVTLGAVPAQNKCEKYSPV
jgi:hypothetical protein